MTLPTMPAGYRWFRGGPGLSRAGRNALFASDDTTVWVWDEETGNPVTDLLDETATPISAPKVVDGWVLGAGLPTAVRVASFSLGKDGKRYALEPANSLALTQDAQASAASSASSASSSASSAAASAALVGAPAGSAIDAHINGGTSPAVRKGDLVLNVKDYGAKGDGTTDDISAINAAVAAASAGSTIAFPPASVRYKITAPITGKSGVKYVGSRGVEIRQATQYQPVFDLFNVDGCTVSGFTLSNSTPPPSTGPNARGDAGYAFSCGVWTNGSRHTITDLKIADFGMAINLNSSNGTTNVGDHAKRVGNTVRDVEISGANHGVVMLNQDQAYIANVLCRDHVDSAAGANPMHAVYVTGTDIDRSTNLTITGCRDVNNSNGQAFQFKYTYGLVLSDLSASACFGLFNAVDIFDVTASNLSSVGDTHTSGGFTIQKGTNNPARINMDRVSIQKAVDATAEVIVGCDDAKFSNFTLYTLKNGLNVASSDVQVRGNRISVDGFRLRNSGPSSARAFIVGAAAYPTSDVTVSNFEVDGYRNLVDIDSTVTGNNVIQYAPGQQRRISFGTSGYVAAVSGSPPFVISRTATANTYQVTAAGTYYPLGGLETVSRFNVTTASGFTLREPLLGSNPPVGTVHEVAIKNATAGAMGTVTWNALYVWKSGSAPASPASGTTLNVRFMWDGGAWRET